MLPLEASAGTLELREADQVGAGTGYRRGDDCLVLTANHVVQRAAGPVTVLDRSGARARGQVIYGNPEYDVALVRLDPGFAVACGGRWPDAKWIASATWTARTELEVERHYPDGKQAVMLLRWAGGTADTLSLARTDRMPILASDSGSLVRFEGRAVGIVRSVDTAVDRVEVLRFDVIDRLVGDRFRSLGAAALGFEGVIHRGKPQPTWTTYVQAWLTEGARRPLVAPNDPQARCRLRVDVLDWSNRALANPEYEAVQHALAGCKTNFLIRNSRTLVQACEDGNRNKLKTTPRQVRVHALQLKVDVTPSRSATQSALRNVELVEPTEAGGGRAQTEQRVLQEATAQVIQPMLGGNCD